MSGRQHSHFGSVDPVQQFQEGVRCQEQGRLREAAQLFRSILDADRRHLGALNRLGLILLQQGNFLEAMQMFRRAVKIDKTSADAQFYLAVALTGQGQLDEAVKRYDRALVLRPVFPEAHNNLGHALQLLGQHEAAATHYEKAIAARPNYVEALNNLGNTLHVFKKFDAAITQYEKALAIRPEYPEALNNLGNALASIGRHEEAIAHFRGALALKPNFVDAYHSLGNTLGVLGRLEEAIAQYETAVKIGPDYAQAHLELGNALSALSLYEEAIIEYDRALALNPHYVEALTARGHVLMRVGRDAEAAKVFNDLVKGGTHSLDVLVALSTVPTPTSIDLLSELDRLIDAECEDMTQLDKAAFVRAIALDRMGRHAEAWECLERANRRVFLSCQAELGAETAAQRSTLERLETRPTMSAAARGPVTSLFILGPSRCGKTVLERLLSTLPGVRRGYEGSSIVDEAIRRTIKANELPAGALFEDFTSSLHSFCQSAYADLASAKAGSGARLLTNTLPGRIHSADLVAEVFPEVRILCVRRDVSDVSLRIYQRRYRTGNAYSYDLQSTRDHVLWYYQAMDLLLQKFPDRVRVVQYEEMVADPARALCIAADLCGLSMTDQPVTAIGDDRGCAAPYVRFMAAELADQGERNAGSPAHLNRAPA